MPNWSEKVDQFIKIKGGKFQNLKYFYETLTEKFSSYSLIAVFDDDIRITPEDLEVLFDAHENLRLKVSQPSFCPSGKISHGITAQNLATLFRYSNFVEMTCPIFDARFLSCFLEKFDGSLSGYGADLWYSSLLKDDQKAMAIIDHVSVRNPLDCEKIGKKREIEKLASQARRIEEFYVARDKYQIDFDIHNITTSLEVNKPRNCALCLRIINVLIHTTKKLKRQLICLSAKI